MKRLFFVGKFNTVYEDINNYLADYYNLQVCVDNIELMKGILRLNHPDLVIISLIGLNEESEDILNEFKYRYPGLPVICIGTESEQQHFKKFLLDNQFTMLTRPISNDKIKETIDELLSEKEPVSEEDFEAKVLAMAAAEGAGTTSNDTSAAKEAATAKEKVSVEDEKKCIMFIDDDYVQLRMFYEMFKTQYEVLAASSAMKALTMFGKRVPDIIFLDYDMPMCDGKMTMQMIRELDEAKQVPIIFLTGVRDAEHIQAVLALRPAGYLLKPASEDMIRAEIAKHI